MRAYTYVSPGTLAWMDKPKPVLQHPRDATVRVTLASICTSDLHIKHGAVPRAVPGITLGHEMVGLVEEVGSSISRLHPGDRVAVNVETFCGDCFVCRHGYVNNCTDPNGGWALGCRIDGGQAEYVRVRTLTRDSRKSRMGCRIGRPFSPGTCWPPVSGPPGSPTLRQRTRSSF